MQKINFENYPSTNTPIDANNLNDLQDNVEEAIKDDLNNFVILGETDNQEKTITLNNDSLSNYKFICVVSGYGYYKCSTTIPVALFKNFNNSYNQCMQYVKTYNSNAYTSINYINDTSFKINGNVGTDVITSVYGIK